MEAPSITNREIHSLFLEKGKDVCVKKLVDYVEKCNKPVASKRAFEHCISKLDKHYKRLKKCKNNEMDIQTLNEQHFILPVASNSKPKVVAP